MLGFRVFDLVSRMHASMTGGASTDSIKDAEKAPVQEPVEQIQKCEMEVYVPKYTRPIASKFEYAGALTSLAKYLETLSSLSKYVDAAEINDLPNTAYLAYMLFEKGKMDCILERNNGVEKVSLSKLYINEIWKRQIEEYFKSKRQSMEKELFEQISTVLDSDDTK